MVPKTKAALTGEVSATTGLIRNSRNPDTRALKQAPCQKIGGLASKRRAKSPPSKRRANGLR